MWKNLHLGLFAQVGWPRSRPDEISPGSFSVHATAAAFQSPERGETFACAAAEALSLVVVTAPGGALALKAGGPPAKSE